MRNLFIRAKRMYHRWVLRRAIKSEGMKISVYHASTNSYTAVSHGHEHGYGLKWHVYVTKGGAVRFDCTNYGVDK